MPDKWLGVVVGSESLVVVQVAVSDSGEMTLEMDDTWPLQSGDRSAAYSVMYQRVASFAQEQNIDRAIIKQSALSQGSPRMGHLHACELRGVVMAALASRTAVQCISKALISRTFGSRKVDEYVDDNEFWAENVKGGPLRKGSREAAIILLAVRGRE